MYHKKWDKIKRKYLKFEAWKEELTKDGSVIEITPAPEPSDIYWDNLTKKTSHKMILRTISDIVTIILLIISGIIILKISEEQEHNEKKT